LSERPPAIAASALLPLHEAESDDADARMTAARDEIKYLVPQRSLDALVRALVRKLPHHRFAGAGANQLPGPQHFVTTIYFDTPAREQYRAARAHSEHTLKLRAKEYYDLHPSLAELATDPAQIVRYQPVVWLELKSKHGTRTGKRRIGIPKRELPGFFAHGVVTPELIAIQQQASTSRAPHGEALAAERALHAIAEYCRGFAEPLRADCLVNYRRLPWQSEDGALRVTLDVELAYYAAPADLWQRSTALVRESLGVPRAREAGGVLELKTRGAVPEWLNALLVEVAAEPRAFSKFEAASEAVHGAGC
jgi:hypothetical protein